jgi:hypothetical protein
MFILELERYYTSQVYNVVFKLNAKLHHVQHHVVGTLEHKNEEIFEEMLPTVNKVFGRNYIAKNECLGNGTGAQALICVLIELHQYVI